MVLRERHLTAKNPCSGSFPGWFSELMQSVGPQLGKHHDLAEGILGISRLVNEGNLKEALRLAYKLNLTLNLYIQNPGLPGEQDSTQTGMMIASGLYPPDVCEWVGDLLDLGK